MSNSSKNIALPIAALLFSFLLLISCKASAYEVLAAKDFSKTIAQLSELIKTDGKLARQKLELLVKNVSAYTPSQQIAIYNVYSEFLLDYGQVQVAKDNALWGLDVAKGNNLINRHVVELTYTLGFATESFGDLAQAELDYASGLEIAQSLNNEALITKGLVNLGAIYYLTERFDLSLLALSDALKIAERLNDNELKGLVTSEFGILYGYLEQADKAQAFYRQCQNYFSQINDHVQALNCTINMGMNELNNQNYEQAATIFKAAEKKLTHVPNTDMAHNIFLNLSIALLKQKESEPEASYQYLQIAEQYIDDLEHYEAKMGFLMSKAYILSGLEKYDEAMAVIDHTVGLIPRGDSYKIKMANINVLFIRTQILAGMKQYQQAFELQVEYEKQLFAIEQHERMTSIQELRVQYESEQADIEQKILQEKQRLQELSLSESSKQKEIQFYSVVVIAVIILIFAWWLSRLMSAHNRLYQLTRTDELTGIANRHHLTEIGEQMFSQALADKSPLSVLMIDIDHFKAINDTLGHSSGDTILKLVTNTIKGLMRSQDVFGRVGGEEFVCYLPQTNKEQAMEVARRLVEEVAGTSMGVSTPFPVTISVGVSSIEDKENSSIEALLNQADSNMYRAKDLGRNQVC